LSAVGGAGGSQAPDLGLCGGHDGLLAEERGRL